MNQRSLLYGALVVTMDPARRQYNDGALLIEGDRIARIGRSADLLAEVDEGVQRIDLRGRIVLPGLINTHVHTSQQLGRGLADDVDLLTWLHDRIWPYESSMDAEDSYISSLLCGIEQIRSGVTCFAEAGGQFVDGMARAVADLGLRAILVRSTMDSGEGLPVRWHESTEKALDEQVEAVERWHHGAEDRLRVWFGLRTIFNATDNLILRTKELADRYGVGINMHVAEIEAEVEFARAERGATTVAHLEALGVLDKNLLAVHSVWLTYDEMELFRARDVKVSHCPAAAMRVLGFARIPDMLACGICVSLGTDGAPSNNRMTLVDEMWLASLIHKGRRLDPTVVPAEAVLAMATCDGARALLWDDAIGSLEPGKKADLIVVDPNSVTMLPLHDPIANLVSAMRSDNITGTMAGGRWLMRDRQILTVDEPGIIAEGQRRAALIAGRAGITLPQRFNVVDPR
jgi:5-methylthioadenosine/S-adenosylhomocysteine deaminase